MVLVSRKRSRYSGGLVRFQLTIPGADRSHDSAERYRLRSALDHGAKPQNGFANGLDKFLSVPEQPLMAASGAWSANDVFNVKLVLYQTPFYSALTFKFDGDQLLFDAEYNVSFGPRNLPQLVGQSASTP